MEDYSSKNSYISLPVIINRMMEEKNVNTPNPTE
jgi:hypothetical protein